MDELPACLDDVWATPPEADGGTSRAAQPAASVQDRSQHDVGRLCAQQNLNGHARDFIPSRARDRSAASSPSRPAPSQPGIDALAHLFSGASASESGSLPLLLFPGLSVYGLAYHEGSWHAHICPPALQC